MRLHRASISEYDNLVSKLKARIQLVQSKCVAELKELEVEHFKQHGTLPDKTSNSEYSAMLKKRNMAKQILRMI